MSRDKRVNVLTGAVRSGKTWISLVKWALFVAASPPEYRFLMAARTVGTLSRNCLEPLMEIVGKDNFEYSAHNKKAVLFGRTIWLEGVDDDRSEAKIRGLTLAGAYLDELTLLKRDFFHMLLSRLSLPGAVLYATTNPDSPSHWVKREIIDNERLGALVWQFRLEDNIFLPDEYVESIKKEYCGVFYDRFILGKWVSAEGVIYREFAENRMKFAVASVEEFEKRVGGKVLRIFAGLDFGGTKSAHALVACGFTDRGQVIVLKSRRVPGAECEAPEDLYFTVMKFLEEVRELRAGDVDALLCDGAEPVLIRGLSERLRSVREFSNVRVRAAVKKRIIDRIRLTLSLIGNGRFFYVEKDAKSLADALSEARWSEKSENERLDDGSTDVDSLDAFEYALSGAKIGM